MNNPSRDYLRKLTIVERAELAKKVDASPEYLYQIGINYRNPSRKLAAKLEVATAGRVRALDFDSEIMREVTSDK